MPRYIDVYPFITDIADGVVDDLIIVPSFECAVSIDLDFVEGEPVARCSDVFVDGQSIRGCGAVATAIRLKVMMAADAELAAGGPLWDAVAAREGVAFIGPAGSPDAYWARV